MKSVITKNIKYFSRFELILFSLFFIFSSFLMWKTFSINKQGNLEIGAKLWSDFAATTPLIRSFTYGDNFPPEYPIFPGQPIRYHFIFFALVGILERLGVRIDIALNLFSSVSFTLLLIFIYLFGKIVFKKVEVSIISVVLFLLNGSWGFLEFFKNHKIGTELISEIIKNETFSSFGPYDQKIVSAFWSLNIYTNQRHLSLAYAFYLFLVLLFYLFSENRFKFTWTKAITLGVITGLFPFFHSAVFGMIGLTLIVFLILYPKIRTKIILLGIVSLIVAIPQFLYVGKGNVEHSFIHLGYLIENKSFFGFLNYWFLNLGLTSILAPLGFLLANRSQKKLLIPFLIFFIVGNIFRFTPDVPTNHKFFNLFVIGLNFYTAYFLVLLWNKTNFTKLFVAIMIFFLTLTGIIDFFPVVNDKRIELIDIPNNKTALFILKNTPKDSVFLNGSFLYDPASLAGRKIYLGWPYFSWGAGYHTNFRYSIMKKLLSADDKKVSCKGLKNEKIDYIEVRNPPPLEDFTVNYDFFKNNFVPVFNSVDESITIYNVSHSCRK